MRAYAGEVGEGVQHALHLLRVGIVVSLVARVYHDWHFALDSREHVHRALVVQREFLHVGMNLEALKAHRLHVADKPVEVVVIRVNRRHTREQIGMRDKLRMYKSVYRMHRMNIHRNRIYAHAVYAARGFFLDKLFHSTVAIHVQVVKPADAIGGLMRDFVRKDMHMHIVYEHIYHFQIFRPYIILSHKSARRHHAQVKRRAQYNNCINIKL